MVRDSSVTRQRLLQAAFTEFAERGFAGARVDRIGDAAGVNKAQIYHHFGSKDGLFDAVFDQIVEATLSETPIDPADLPEYAGKLFDRYTAQPAVQRIATWHRLERGDSHRVSAISASYEEKLRELRAAQRSGTLSKQWPPEVLLTQVLALSAMWATVTPELDGMLEAISLKRRRKAVVDSVAALLAHPR